MSLRAYAEYRTGSNAFIPQVPAHWTSARFDAMVRTTRDLFLPVSKDDSGTAFLYSIPAVQEQGDGEYVETASIDSAKLIVAEPTVLLSKLNPRKSTTCVAEPKTVLTVASSEFVPLIPQTMELKFLGWFVQSEPFKSRLEGLTESATRSHQRVSPSDILKAWWDFPPIDEQSHISTFLDREAAKIDALIAEQERLVALLDEKRQAVITEAVTKGLEPTVPMKDSRVEWIGEVPADWKVPPLRQLARLESGHTPSRQKPEWWRNCTIPWFTLSDIWQVREEGREVIHETSERVSELGLANSSARLLPEGTVMLSRTASVGFAAVMGQPMATSQDFANWVCGPDLSPSFLLRVFQAMTPEFERLKFGSTHNTIYMPDIAAFRCPAPPRPEQERIVAYLQDELNSIRTLRESSLQAIDLLRERRSALVSAAVTGQIDVRGLVEAEAA